GNNTIILKEKVNMNKVAIITGGSRGIGEAMTLKLGEMGYNVAINYRSESSKKLSDDLAEKITKEYGVEAIVVRADVSKYSDCENLVESTVEKFGSKVDVLINNAGITNNCNFIDLTEEAYTNVINTNLMSFLHMCHLTLPYMVDHEEHANIINTSSIGGLMGVVNQGDYCAAKSGVIGLTRALAIEFASRKVRVNAIAPGMIMTDMLRGVNQEELKALASTIPMGYIGDISDISSCMEYMLKASYLTGQVISPNGGVIMP
ncbi:MAG TPA: SDR family NAD(P)-dependent oxidoreductase, partial [Lachnospiraceae bacterium]|nr:SDR family NAD(P)-dependent oxidoreductase [Lachnospiraceae bacterium]